MSAHTPGEWASHVPPSSCHTHRFIVAERGSGHNPVIAEVGSRMTCDDEVSIFESVANARLIAAAPELLAFAQERATGAARNVRRCLKAGDVNAALAVLSVFEFNTEAAIAKATGKD